MGFLDRFFSKETKQEAKVKEDIKGNEVSYAQATNINVPVCNGCGQDIEGKPRMMKNGGNMLYFHKRCIRAMHRGELPKPKFTNDV